MSTPALPTYVETLPEGADEPDPATAALVFRVGVADTAYPQHGQLHVLMRLLGDAAAHLPVQRRPLVGTVSSSVEVTGAPSDVVEALETMTAWLNDPDWSSREAITEQVVAEDDVLSGADDELAAAALCRWGRRGVGLIGLAPAGVSRTSAEDIDRWRVGHLTAGNGCLVTDHPTVGELDLRLPEGPAVPPRVPPGLALALPGRTPRLDRAGTPVVTHHGSATITALTRHPAATRVLAGVLTTRLQGTDDTARARTRTRAVPVGDQLLWLYEHSAKDPGELYAALRDVAHGDLDPTALESTLQRLSTVSRGGAMARAERRALADLCGLPLIRDLADVSVDEVVAEARAAVPTVLALGGPATDSGGGTELRLVAGPEPGPGGAVRSRYRSRRLSAGQLTLAENTCEATAGDNRQVVAWDDLVAVHHHGPGRRVLVPRHGPVLTVDAARWRDGEAAVAAVDATVPSEIVVTSSPPTSHDGPLDPTDPTLTPWVDPAEAEARGVGAQLKRPVLLVVLVALVAALVAALLLGAR